MFPVSCTILHSHQPCMEFQCRPAVLSTSYFLFCFAFVLWIVALLASVGEHPFSPNWHWTYRARWVERDLSMKKDANQTLDTVHASVLQFVSESDCICASTVTHVKCPVLGFGLSAQCISCLQPFQRWPMGGIWAPISFNREGKWAL